MITESGAAMGGSKSFLGHAQLLSDRKATTKGICRLLHLGKLTDELTIKRRGVTQ